MHNVSYQWNPLFWKDYSGQEVAKHLAKKFILGGASALPRSLFIDGKSGTGKTSFVRLLMRSYRCLNRKDDEFEPCGVCDNCTKTLDERLGSANDGTNCIWVQPGDRSKGTLDSQVKEALIAADKGQVSTGRPHRDVLFIIFDEWQAYSTNLRQEVLLRSEVEVEGNQVCFVFITMKVERLDQEDRKALLRRSCPISMGGFTVDQIVSFLQERFKGYPLASLQMIAENSYQSPGLSLAILDSIHQVDPDLGIETTAYMLRHSTAILRKSLWDAVSTQYVKNIKESLENVSNFCSHHTLATQMMDDIIRTIELGKKQPTIDQLTGLGHLRRFAENSDQNISFLPYLLALGDLKGLTCSEVFEEGQLNFAV